ncbi:uncharacterized protein OCT59_005175 [Rhizophagus irregularis]|uniref:Uncharacterized protein n=3 Tax=Rhizophagus irregularis TaxID=588596 RepID=A0A015JX86_RHIIW|nr:hypothetical protein GLOIN_2v1677622 [Rhizophagus irregularis DAOM 181602=DAOM 197198]EXX51761.1 hypothetical protein RirG_258870 [Rhizophagus irregularis DAOM 197198w]UZO13681.1 hypothetical protein OCT59_005175 [Rhizophagus irregularis]POG64189.1 hypothetical protein GLOIN_2v1677622 [Rhizophagus irregularis DAOM 181602=DAOM 197198]CAG8453399.1 5307_t:CDS:1 [Rhizophagus irregularis]GBC21270.1 hypothetical protein GLOIN_2v1677622 [Rhizophagus irregularis DAOM 181602=DAOM 197198]|eukprot:XP_025171055.1 hypothetical protein GLOIN_2v1677622 [Rhizophagus irregularis DAOM 181602=DAOM 197198]
MPSHYVYVPFLVLCAPLIISVLGTFTLFAILTSSLALFVISIRLGFLAVEFSGGVVFDFIKWGINKLSLERGPQKNTKITIKDTIHNKQRKHILKSTKTTIYNSNGSGNNYVSNDDYFMMSMINNKRPNGRRARSDYI